MKTICFFIIVLFFSLNINLYSQSWKVRDCIKKINSGKIDEVKQDYLDLSKRHPDDPGVMLLGGLLNDNAYEAVEIYESILKNHPQSEWADDAYWRVVQFYAIKGDTALAKKRLADYRNQYPTSEFLPAATDVVNFSIAFAKSKPSNEPKSKQTSITSKSEQTSTQSVWGWQVGVYSTQEAAQKESQRYQKQRLRSETLIKDIDGAKMYAVIIGHYLSIDSAEKNKHLVEQICNCKPLLFKKQ